MPSVRCGGRRRRTGCPEAGGGDGRVAMLKQGSEAALDCIIVCLGKGGGEVRGQDSQQLVGAGGGGAGVAATTTLLPRCRLRPLSLFIVLFGNGNQQQQRTPEKLVIGPASLAG